MRQTFFPERERTRRMGSGAVVALLHDTHSGALAVSELLRRLRALARSLGRTEHDAWIDGELHGFTWSEVPPYRRVQASLVGDFLSARVRVTGCEIPEQHFPDEIAAMLRDLRLQPGVAALEELQSMGSGRYVRVDFPQHVVDTLAPTLTMSDGGRLTALGQRVGRAVIAEVLEHVRSEIDRIASEWAHLARTPEHAAERAGALADEVPSDPANAWIRYCWRSRWGRRIILALGGVVVLCLVAKSVREAIGPQ